MKIIDGVTYVPIHVALSSFERKYCKYWDAYIAKMLPLARLVVEKYKPDIIHVFGTEWLFGQIAAFTEIPVAIHIMGAIVPYNNANYPPGYSSYNEIIWNLWNPLRLLRIWKRLRNMKNWERLERNTWALVNNYMGRTKWDESLSRIMHPGRNYYHVEEALRTVFLLGDKLWQLPEDNKLRLVSIGCSTFWKGPDMMLKVAKIFVSLKVNFEWLVAGRMDHHIKKWVERQENVRFEEMNINFLGFKQPNELVNILCSSTMYVHTAYIENSPNAICEAQCLGLPVVSTNVGGISTLVRPNMDGVLVAANDPWQMADAIIELYKDKERMIRYSQNSRAYAIARHNDESIKKQLLDCYINLLNN